MGVVVAFIVAIMCGVLIVCIVCDVYALLCTLKSKNKESK